jgi:hypothetical protein
MSYAKGFSYRHYPLSKVPREIKYMEKSANYVHVTGNGHCFMCHKDYFNDHDHILHCKAGEPTQCTKACGKWFKPPQTPEWSVELEKSPAYQSLSEMLKGDLRFFISTTIAKEREEAEAEGRLWRLAIVHLSEKDRNSVIETYEKLLAHQALK